MMTLTILRKEASSWAAGTWDQSWKQGIDLCVTQYRVPRVPSIAGRVNFAAGDEHLHKSSCASASQLLWRQGAGQLGEPPARPPAPASMEQREADGTAVVQHVVNGNAAFLPAHQTLPSSPGCFVPPALQQ